MGSDVFCPNDLRPIADQYGVAEGKKNTDNILANFKLLYHEIEAKTFDPFTRSAIFVYA